MLLQFTRVFSFTCSQLLLSSLVNEFTTSTKSMRGSCAMTVTVRQAAAALHFTLDCQQRQQQVAEVLPVAGDGDEVQVASGDDLTDIGIWQAQSWVRFACCRFSALVDDT